MPTKRKSPSKTILSVSVPETSFQTRPIFTRKYLLILIAFIFLVVLVSLNKSWFVVALVNGRPITRFTLDRTLVKNFGTQTLENMISDELVRQEIAKQNVVVSSQEVDQDIARISAGLPSGITLDQALQFQGIDLNEFKEQEKMRLSVDKLLASQITVSDKEVDSYLATNSAQFKNATPAAAKTSARSILERQKESAAFTSWFSDLRQKGKVLNFL